MAIAAAFARGHLLDHQISVPFVQIGREPLTVTLIDGQVGAVDSGSAKEREYKRWEAHGVDDGEPVIDARVECAAWVCVNLQNYLATALPKLIPHPVELLQPNSRRNGRTNVTRMDESVRVMGPTEGGGHVDDALVPISAAAFGPLDERLQKVMGDFDRLGHWSASPLDPR